MAKHRWTEGEIAQYRREHGVFYFNRADKNIFVPKMSGLGLTFNWGHPVAWIAALIVVVLIVAIAMLRK